MNERIDPQTGEVLDKISNLPATIDNTMAVAIARAEIDTQIATARAFPRSVQTAVNDINSLATMNDQMAAECIYALPRAGKPVRGASIRLAEIIAQSWGNCVSEARIVSIDRINKIVTAEGIFHDLQTNTVTKATAERRISTKDGRIFGDDMITVTCNAARSIARRNAILGGVPRVVWWQAYQQCEKVIAGDVTTLAVKRAEAIKAFAVFGLKPEQVFQLLDVKGEQDIGLDELVTLRGSYAAVKNGEMTVEELLASRAPQPQPVTASARKTLDDFANGGNTKPISTQDQSPPASEQGAPDVGNASSGAPAASSEIAGNQPEGSGEAKTPGAAAAGKPAAKEKTAAASPGPKTEAEYVAHANAWLDGGEDADLLEQQWTSEKSMRNKANVTAGVRQDLVKKVEEKAAKLRGQK